MRRRVLGGYRRVKSVSFSVLRISPDTAGWTRLEGNEETKLEGGETGTE